MPLKNYLYFLFLLCAISCKKFIEIGAPQNQLVTSNVYTSDATAKSAMDGIYSLMMSKTSFASGNITLYSGLSADELDNYSTAADQIGIYSNNILTTNGDIESLWSDAFNYIYDVNAILDGLKNSNSVSDALKLELEGEAKFIRAYCNFYLTNLFGDIPLTLTTDYRINASLFRTSQDSVYGQIMQDLTDAQSLLAADYSYSSGERIRPNKYAAIALLARTYLYKGDWANAEEQATDIINNPTYTLINNLDSVFLKNSEEAIWQLAPVRPNENTREEITFGLTTTPRIAALSSKLITSFELNDQRRNHWVDSVTVNGIKYYFPYKYKIFKTGLPVTEYYMMLRLAEQYLIRAEARAEQNKLTGTAGAIADLNVIRHRAGLSDYNGPTNQAPVLAAIQNERKIELFTEWGHRWFDLKRTNAANSILSSKPGWQSTDVLYPIPETEITDDPNLSQNDGYQGVSNK